MHVQSRFVARLLVSAAACALSLPASAQTTTRVSVSSVGIGSDANGSFWTLNSCISADGRVVAFSSSSSALVPGDLNATFDVFVHERQTGALERVSVGAGGVEGNNPSGSAALSADGSIVAFASAASNLVAGDTNGRIDVFVRDRVNGTIERVSVDGLGQQGNGDCDEVALSADGNVVAFASQATNLVTPDANGPLFDLFVRERSAGTTERVDVSSAGVQGNQQSPANSGLRNYLSGDGRFVVFDSWASNLVAGDTNSQPDVFVRDRLLATTIRASVGSLGQPAVNASMPAISRDGRYVVFMTSDSNLVPGVANGFEDVYVRDLQLGTTEIASLDSSGAQANERSDNPMISADGRFVAFDSQATNLVVGDTNAKGDVFLRDRQTGQTIRSNVSTLGAQTAAFSYGESISDDGSCVTFRSYSNVLVPGDAANSLDAFVADTSHFAPAASYCTPKTSSHGCVPRIGASGAPLATGFDAFFLTAENVLNKKTGIVFWGLASNSAPFGGGTLCVAAPIVRGPLQSSGGTTTGSNCTGVYFFHFTQATMSAEGLLPGATVYAQFWSRDPGFAPPSNIGLSDAVSFTIAP